MNVSRESHLRYTSRLTPVLIGAYVIQSFLYRNYLSPNMAWDAVLFLGVGLALIIVAFNYYDHHHKITLKENFLEVRFDVLKIHQEVLYQHIQAIELKPSRHNFAQVSLHLKNGDVCVLRNVDDAQRIKDLIETKKSKHTQAA